MFDTARDDVGVTRAKRHGVLTPVLGLDRNVEPAFEDQEELVRVLMNMPDVISFGVSDSHVVVIDSSNDPRAVDLVEGSERFTQVDGFHGRSLSDPSSTVLYNLDMDPDIPATCRVVAWRPPISGISEVFHARIVDWRYPIHCHDTWTILIVDEGAISYDLDTRHHGAIGDSVTILPPGVPHNGMPTERTFHKRNLYLDSEFLSATLVGRAVDQSTFRDAALRMAISRLHDRLLDEPDEMDVESRLVEIAERFRHRLAPNDDAIRRSDSPLAGRLRTYLRENLANKVTLREAATQFDRSDAHLVRTFKQAYGITPYAYLIGLRIERARQQLLTGVPPARVAVESGFHDQAHLSRHFRRHVSVTPGRYARQGFNLARGGG